MWTPPSVVDDGARDRASPAPSVARLRSRLGRDDDGSARCPHPCPPSPVRGADLRPARGPRGARRRTVGARRRARRRRRPLPVGGALRSHRARAATRAGRAGDCVAAWASLAEVLADGARRWARPLSAAVAAYADEDDALAARIRSGRSYGAPGVPVTAPAGEPAALRLAAVAAWDVSLLRGAVATLDAVAGRLRAWRARLDGVGRSLASGECWTGPPPAAPVAVADELSAAAWAVDVAVAGSLAAFERLAREADARPGARRAGARARRRRARPCGDGPVPSTAPPSAATRCAHAAAAAARGRRRGGTRWPASASGTRRAPADLAAPGGRGRPARRRVVPTRRRAGGGRGLVGRSVGAGAAGGDPARARRRGPARRCAGLGPGPGQPARPRPRPRDPRTPRPAAATARAVARRIRAEEAAGRQVAAAPARPGRRPGGPGARRPRHRRRGGRSWSPASATPRRTTWAALTGDARDVGSPRAGRRARADGRDGGLARATGRPARCRRSSRGRRPGRADRALAAGLAGLAAARTATGQPAAAHHRARAQLRHGRRRRGGRRPRRAGRRRRRPARAAPAWRRTRAASRCRRSTTPRLGRRPDRLAWAGSAARAGARRLRVDRAARRIPAMGHSTTTTPDSADPGRDRRGGRRRARGPPDPLAGGRFRRGEHDRTIGVGSGDGTPTMGRPRPLFRGVAYRGPPRGRFAAIAGRPAGVGESGRATVRRHPAAATGGRATVPPTARRRSTTAAPPTGAPCPRRPARPEARAPTRPPAARRCPPGGRRPRPGASRWSSSSRRPRRTRSPATWAAATSSRPASGTSATCRATPPTCRPSTRAPPGPGSASTSTTPSSRSTSSAPTASSRSAGSSSW